MSTWVLLRGLTREARHWGDFPGVLEAEIAGSRVVCVDLPGNGRAHRLDSPTCVMDMAERCGSLLAAQGVKPPYHLLALSLGAMVAVGWSLRRPGEVAGMVLINTSLRPFSPFFHRLRPGSYGRLLFATLLPAGSESRERNILTLTSCRGAGQSELLREWCAYARECPVTRLNALRQLAAAARFRAPAVAPAVRGLLLASDEDRIVNPACSRRLAAAWGWPLAVHASAGHDLPLDDPQWVARQVAVWLRPGPG